MKKNIQENFIEFLIAHQALKFGHFTLKSGRISPYFFNLGVFSNGQSLSRLGQFFATALLESQFQYDLLFGPAYKGITLACATSIALFRDYQKNVPISFNRKEKKQYGDRGGIIGEPLAGRIVMLDDVITAGTTVKETIEVVKDYQAHLTGILIAFDRQERGEGQLSAVKEIAERYSVPIQSIITLNDVLSYLDKQPSLRTHIKDIENYQREYGISS